jgi:hypothetical protein
LASTIGLKAPASHHHSSHNATNAVAMGSVALGLASLVRAPSSAIKTTEMP